MSVLHRERAHTAYAIKTIDHETRALIDAAICSGKLTKCPPRKYSVDPGQPDAGTGGHFKRKPVDRELDPKMRKLVDGICAAHGVCFKHLMRDEVSVDGSKPAMRQAFFELHSHGLTYEKIGHVFGRSRSAVASIIRTHKERLGGAK